MTPHARVLASCIMPTANRRGMVAASIALFQRQTHPNREMIILDDGVDAVADLVPRDVRIRYVHVPPGLSLGAKRNRACELAAGDVIVHWGDDDWYPPDRIARQVATLASGGAACGTSRLFLRDSVRPRAWEYSYRAPDRKWVAGTTLAYRRSTWERHRCREVHLGDDAHVVWGLDGASIVDLDDPSLCVAAMHGGNPSPQATNGAYWRPLEASAIARVIDAVDARPTVHGRALVAVASGIGDVIRATPVIRVLYRLGFAVDVLSAPDYPHTTELLEGAPEIARVIRHPEPIGDVEYDVACFAYWAQPLASIVRTKRRLGVDRAVWLRDGDSAWVEQMARSLGWADAVPAPFVVSAPSRLELPEDTVAIHAGCKQGWPWKKWHGFPGIAAALANVAVIGTEEDQVVTGTYFEKSYEWPAHARNFVGRLSLGETAALIQQSAALICNDSGLQHIGAAVGTPTYPIYGITSPEREAIPLTHVRPVTKGLSCEGACRREPWGRRDCHRHLECLRTMDATDVIDRIERDGVALTRYDSHAKTTRYPVAAFPTETVSVAVQMAGGVGDVVLGSPLLRALFDALIRCEIDVFYHSPEAAKQVFAGARFVRAVRPVAHFTGAERQYDLSIRVATFVRYSVRDGAKLRRVAPEFTRRLDAAMRQLESVRGLADRQPSLDGVWGRLSVRSGRTLLDGLGLLGGVDVSRDTELFFSPEPAAYRALDERLGGPMRRYVTLHDGFDNMANVAPGTATKCWPMEHWQRLVAELQVRHPDLALVQVGARKSRHIPGVHVDLVDRTSLHEAAWIIKGAELHMDTDSGLVHIARALHTPSIALFGPTNAGYHGHSCNTNLSATSCGDCWWSTPDWLARCPRGLATPECMQSILPEHVLAEVDRRLAGREAGTRFVQAGEIECYDGQRCLAGAAQLRDMCDVLDLPLVPISRHARNEQSGVYIHASKQWEYLYALDAIEKRFGGRLGLRVADLGAGRGALAPYLAHRGHEVEAFDRDYRADDGGDPSVEPRHRAWARTVGYRASFGALHNVPAASASFDVVTSISVVEHVLYKEYALKEALRLLRPGGLLVLTFDLANAPERFEDGLRREIFSPERVRVTLARLGIACVVPEHDEVEASARLIQADGVLGIPVGMTVAGMVIRKPE